MSSRNKGEASLRAKAPNPKANVCTDFRSERIFRIQLLSKYSQVRKLDPKGVMNRARMRSVLAFTGI
jgi:adenylylsulfate kinase-like enzyme